MTLLQKHSGHLETLETTFGTLLTRNAQLHKTLKLTLLRPRTTFAEGKLVFALNENTVKWKKKESVTNRKTEHFQDGVEKECHKWIKDLIKEVERNKDLDLHQDGEGGGEQVSGADAD